MIFDESILNFNEKAVFALRTHKRGCQRRAASNTFTRCAFILLGHPIPDI